MTTLLTHSCKFCRREKGRFCQKPWMEKFLFPPTRLSISSVSSTQVLFQVEAIFKKYWSRSPCQNKSTSLSLFCQRWGKGWAISGMMLQKTKSRNCTVKPSQTPKMSFHVSTLRCTTRKRNKLADGWYDFWREQIQSYWANFWGSVQELTFYCQESEYKSVFRVCLNWPWGPNRKHAFAHWCCQKITTVLLIFPQTSNSTCPTRRSGI